MDFAARFRDLRTQAGLTKTALAKPRYTVSHVSQIEAGRRRPSAEALQFFSGRLGVSPEYLATGVPEGCEQELRHEIEEARRLVAQGDITEAESKIESVIGRAYEFDLPSLRSRALMVLGDARFRRRQLKEAIDAYEQAIEDGLPTRDEGMTVAALARAYRAMGDLAYAADLVESYMSRSGQGPLDAGVAAELQTVLVSVYFERGQMVRAERTANRAVAAAEQGAPADIRAKAYWDASRVLAEAKRWDDALELAARARIILEQEDDRRRVGRLHNAYAFLCLEAEPPRLEEAASHLERAEGLLSEGAAPGDLAYVYAERCRIALLEGDAPRALRYAQAALEHSGPDELEAGRCLFLKGRALALLRRAEEAKATLHEAEAIFDRLGARQQQASAWREIGELRLADGDVQGALESLRSGLAALDPRRTRA